MKLCDTPTKPGYYWAIWHTNTWRDREVTPELDYLAAHKDQHIVLVRWDSDQPEKLPEGEKLIVHIPGIMAGQYTRGFDWGDQVAEIPPESNETVLWEDYSTTLPTEVQMSE